jgi:hypothetical protein
LLQNDFGEPDSVGIGSCAPRQLPLVVFVPADEFTGEIQMLQGHHARETEQMISELKGKQGLSFAFYDLA